MSQSEEIQLQRPNHSSPDSASNPAIKNRHHPPLRSQPSIRNLKSNFPRPKVLSDTTPRDLNFYEPLIKYDIDDQFLSQLKNGRPRKSKLFLCGFFLQLMYV